MSVYISVEGVLTYKTKEDFANAENLLRDNGYLLADNFYTEDDEFINKEGADLDRNGWQIKIPHWTYRNLGPLLSKVCHNSVGVLVYTCTDGCAEGSVIRDGVEETYDLFEWYEDTTGEEPPSDEAELEEWLDEVVLEFFSLNLPALP